MNKRSIKNHIKEFVQEEKQNRYEMWKDKLTREQLIWIAEPQLKLLFEELWKEKVPKIDPNKPFLKPTEPCS